MHLLDTFVYEFRRISQMSPLLKVNMSGKGRAGRASLGSKANAPLLPQKSRRVVSVEPTRNPSPDNLAALSSTTVRSLVLTSAINSATSRRLSGAWSL